MARFPSITSLAIEDPFGEELNFNTMRTPFANGVEQRKAQQLYVTRNFPIVASNNSVSAAWALYRFFIARTGGFQAFNYFHPYTRTYEDEYVGTADGDTGVFNLPFENGTDIKIYVDGVEQTLTTNYTIGDGTGADGADLLTFTVDPAIGSRILADFTGNLKVRGVFKDDAMPFKTFQDRLVSSGLTIRGLLNA